MTNSKSAAKALTLINDSKMGFEVHGRKCPDLKKKHSDLRENFTAATEQAAREYAIDEDMREMGYTTDDVRVMGCCHFDAEPVEAPKATVKRGTKWTYIYAADGSLVAEVRNDVIDALGASLPNYIAADAMSRISSL